MKSVALLLLIGIALAGWSCKKEEDGDSSQPNTAQLRSAPVSLLANIDSVYTYEVEIEVAAGNARPDSIVCTVMSPTGFAFPSFTLFDDGGARSLWGPEYAGTTSGDVVPNNLKFTRKINGRMLAHAVEGRYEPGNYTFVFTAMNGDGSAGPSTELTVELADVETCVIHSITQVHELPSCFEEYEALLSVNPDNPDAVDSAWYQVLADGAVVAEAELHRVSGDTTWSATIGPRFVRCLRTRDDYEFKYVAKTRFGLFCEAGDTALMIENALPVLANSTLPDLIERPTEIGDTDTVVVTLDLQDCELDGATDFYGLHFDVRAAGSPDWFIDDDYYLRDDGIPADAIAADGHYTVGLRFWRTEGNPDLLYYFRFYAIEGFSSGCAPFDTTEFLVDSVRLVQPGAVAAVPGTGAPEFGIVKAERIEVGE